MVHVLNDLFLYTLYSELPTKQFQSQMNAIADLPIFMDGINWRRSNRFSLSIEFNFLLSILHETWLEVFRFQLMSVLHQVVYFCPHLLFQILVLGDDDSITLQI